MFLGHFALGFAGKRVVPSVSLGTLIVACQLADLLWPTLLLVGLEHVEIRPGITAVTPLDFVSYPWSHSLVALVLWGIAFATIHSVWRRPPLAVSVVLATAVVSHWILDVVAHRPDVPVTFMGGPRLGLGLWNSVTATIAVELALFAAGVAVYWNSTRAKDRVGVHAFLGLVAFLIVAYFAAVFGPPPPSATAVATVGESGWLLLIWAVWVDRHRESPRAS